MANTKVPPADRFCDLVMKGGITSGVVYPRAIMHFAQHYRLKNIGGTSAGAIAAVAAAAAEYRRRHVAAGQALPRPKIPKWTGNSGVQPIPPRVGVADELLGFARLADLPVELGTKVAPGCSKLLSLFQPAATCRRLFSVLVASLNRKTTAGRVLAIVAGVMRAYYVAPIIAAAVFLLVLYNFGHATWFAALLAASFVLLALLGFGIYWDVTRGVVKNDFGLCTGMSDSGKPEALTPWLHALIQSIAGRSVDDAPLTFGDLWKAPGFPPAWPGMPAPANPRSIDLQMFTTNLSHGRPYVLPFDDSERSRLFFKADEIARFVPDSVLQWLREHATPYAPRPSSDDPLADDPTAKDILALPHAADFPILLAARMSLSFPLLFCAVPLWAIDYDSPDKRFFRRCWFSDGGISSNFPIHLFDGLIPSWPTFAIQLEPPLPGRDLVFLPRTWFDGSGELWSKFDEATAAGNRSGKPNPASRLGGFLSAIVAAMQNWNDNTLSRMPGVRDRVVRVRLKDSEGGMNLNMDQAVIKAIADRGEEAARQLCEHYSPPQEGWDNQRWARFAVALTLLQQRSRGVVSALSPSVAHATPYADLVDQGMTKGLFGEKAPFTDPQRAALLAMIDALRQLDAAFNPTTSVYAFDPLPKPDLRIRPSL